MHGVEDGPGASHRARRRSRRTPRRARNAGSVRPPTASARRRGTRSIRACRARKMGAPARQSPLLRWRPVFPCGAAFRRVRRAVPPGQAQCRPRPRRPQSVAAVSPCRKNLTPGDDGRGAGGGASIRGGTAGPVAARFPLPAQTRDNGRPRPGPRRRGPPRPDPIRPPRPARGRVRASRGASERDCESRNPCRARRRSSTR